MSVLKKSVSSARRLAALALACTFTLPTELMVTPSSDTLASAMRISPGVAGVKALASMLTPWFAAVPPSASAPSVVSMVVLTSRTFAAATPVIWPAMSVRPAWSSAWIDTLPSGASITTRLAPSPITCTCTPCSMPLVLTKTALSPLPVSARLAACPVCSRAPGASVSVLPRSVMEPVVALSRPEMSMAPSPSA